MNFIFIHPFYTALSHTGCWGLTQLTYTPWMSCQFVKYLKFDAISLEYFNTDNPLQLHWEIN